VVANRLGYLGQLSQELQEQLDLSAGHGLIARARTCVVNTLGHVMPHVTVLARAALAYAALETTEGVGLALRRRWADGGLHQPLQDDELDHHVLLRHDRSQLAPEPAKRGRRSPATRPAARGTGSRGTAHS
jgi:hypothetical protein